MLPVRTILFPTDRAIARDYGARLIVLHVVQESHVVESPVVYTEANVLYSPPADYRPRHEALKERLHERYASPKLPMDFQVREGDAAEEILRVAEEAEVDLIVIGTHGRTGLGRLLMGSVAEAVLRQARCPILTVKSPAVASAAESGRAGRQAVAT